MMTRQLSRWLRSMLAAMVAALLPAMVCAQAYPAKLIRIVVPFAPAGSADVVARLTEKILASALGQPVIIENRPGAGALIGTEFVAKAPADGYTLLLITSAFAMNPSLYRKIPYDPIKDFEPVSGLTSYPLLLVRHPSLPVPSVKALIALAKAQPGNLNYSSGGIGTSNHVAAEMFAYMAGVRITHIPYKGGGPALTDLVGGHVQIMFAAPSSALPFVTAGRLKTLGVTGAKRSVFLPDVPTIAEAGVPGYELTSWMAVFAPAGTPATIVKRINAEIGKGLRQPDALEILEKQGLEGAAGTPEELAAMVRTEVSKWAKVVKATGIKTQ